MFEEFDDCIFGNHSIDFWEDVGISDAEAILLKFDAGDWSALDGALSERPHDWILRTAQVLGDLESEMACRLLLKISKFDSPELKIAVLDSIRIMLTSEFVSAEDRLYLKETVQSLLPDAGTVDGLVLKAMERDLSL